MNKGRVCSVGALRKSGSIYALSQTPTRVSHVVYGTDELWARVLLTPLSSATQGALAEPEDRTPLLPHGLSRSWPHSVEKHGCSRPCSRPAPWEVTQHL